MREKKPSEKTISKYLDLLKTIHTNSQSSNAYNAVKITEFVKQFQVSKNVIKALKALNIIKITSDIKWDFIGEKPDRMMVLTILDFLLHSRKAQEPAILPNEVTIITLLKKIISNQEKSLKEAKNEATSLKSDLNEEKRFKVALAIASGVYSKIDICYHEWVLKDDRNYLMNSGLPPQKTVCNKCGKEPNALGGDVFDFSTMNNAILMATDDLLIKLNDTHRWKK